MAPRLKAFLSSLGLRLLVPLVVTVGVVLAVHAMISFRSAKEHYFLLVQADVDRYSGLIKRATHDGMLLNLKEEVQSTIERLAEGPELVAVRVYDNEGAIVMSANTEEIGRRIGLDSDTCRSCHDRDATRDTAILERSGLARVNDGPEVLRHLSVIENEAACANAACHAHSSGQRVLGVLDVEMSMAPLEAAIDTAKTQFLSTTMVLIFIVGVVVAVFIRRLVQRPIAQLDEGTRKIADGNLDTRIHVRGRHELARLAEAFNQMARDLKTARSEITDWSQKLEEKVIQKTEELSRAQRQVLHMEKMASLGKLSATVAHELNNPLSGMLVYARLIRKEIGQQPIDIDIRDELTRYLALLEKECSRCGAIVQNLMVFARKTGAAMAPIDLNEVAERSLMLVRHHLEISGVRLNSQLLTDNSQIVADAGQLVQALVALLINAVEAMNGLEEGEAELSLRLRGTDDHVEIEVADNGIGIPNDVLPQIFEPFFSTKDDESGVGLGLAVVYGIVQRHGGDITARSNVGYGSVFHICLPRCAQVEEKETLSR
jgi:two-component system NtrC family sensor kinase